MSAELIITLPGPPRTKKTSSKIWKVGTRTVIKPSQAWIDWRDTVRAYLYQHHRFLAKHAFPLPDQPYNCTALIYRDANRGDAVGYYQGLADVLEDCGILTNDKYLTQWDGTRLMIDRENPRVEIVLTPLLQPVET